MAANVRDVGLETVIAQAAVLTNSGGRIVEWVAAGIVVNIILSKEWVYRQQRGRVNGALIARRNVKSIYFLALVLIRLIVCIGCLKPIPRDKKIEVQGIFARGLEVRAVKNRTVVAYRVNRTKLWCIQKAA